MQEPIWRWLPANEKSYHLYLSIVSARRLRKRKRGVGAEAGGRGEIGEGRDRRPAPLRASPRDDLSARTGQRRLPRHGAHSQAEREERRLRQSGTVAGAARKPRPHSAARFGARRSHGRRSQFAESQKRHAAGRDRTRAGTGDNHQGRTESGAKELRPPQRPVRQRRDPAARLAPERNRTGAGKGVLRDGAKIARTTRKTVGRARHPDRPEPT